MDNERQYVLLPREGITTNLGPAFELLTALPFTFSTRPPEAARLDFAQARPIRVIDTTAENGPKLVELDNEAVEAINAPHSPLRAVPVVEYGRPDPAPRPVGGATVALAAATHAVSVTCTDAATGSGVPGARVIAFSDFALRKGDEAITDKGGQAALRLSATTIERLYVYPPPGYWGAFLQSLSTSSPITITLTPVDLSFVDAVRHYYGRSRFNLRTGVVVGVIDTGVGPHRDLNLVGGRNTVTGESAGDYHDGDIHGTHVSGLVGSNGSPPTGLRGIAPGVPLHSYRVFPGSGGGATNYAILKALILAAQDGCDIVNLSLGGGPDDEIVREAITDARDQGMLVVVAAGNDHRKPVSYPAAYTGATAVTAMGCEGTYAGTLEDGDVLRPPTSMIDSAEFFAAFSNIGPQVALTGPGVGVLSTLPNDQFGPLSGTSMAAPAVAAAAASLLSQDAVVYGMPRTRARSDAIEKLLQANCVKRGFGATYEGYGLPDPATV